MVDMQVGRYFVVVVEFAVKIGSLIEDMRSDELMETCKFAGIVYYFIEVVLIMSYIFVDHIVVSRQAMAYTMKYNSYYPPS